MMEVLSKIDHAALHPTLSREQIEKEMEVANTYKVASLCIHPFALQHAVKRLHEGIALSTVIGFPQGVTFPEIKRAEAVRAISEGAQELDMVMHTGKALEGEWNYVEDEIAAIAEVCHRHNVLLKVILETDFLKDHAVIREACESCRTAKADFVKTSTGFGFVKQKDGNYTTQGAQLEHIRLMAEVVDGQLGVKASGGIRSYEDACKMIEAGASRLGTSSTAKIAEEMMNQTPAT